tara:strand:+ start:120 stop:1646 length:1527 start_codon:yes stop_codon:yes gene_type:complete
MEAHPNTVQFAGDYRLDGIILHNHQNEGINVEDKGIDIQKLVVEMNLFESIYKNSMTGSLVIADSINLIGKLPIQGTERLSFKLSTPGTGYTGHNVDCSERTGNPMHIYKLTNKKQINEGMQTYTLHFCSREFLRNIRTKVSETFEGTIDQMVYKILDDENYLDSRQFFSYQKTRNQDKITIPNKSPFRAIDMLCKKALADDSKSVGYLFYQTTKGFNFRSFESMCVNSNGIPRKAKQTFNYMPMNTDEKITGVLNQKDGELVDKITKDYSSVEQYKFINNFHDVAMNQAMGVYGHRVITHNIFNKSYKVSDYHYHNYFDDTLHVDTSNAPAIVETPVDYDNKSVSDYPESRVTVMSTTQFSHDEETGSFGIDVEQDGITEAARVSQLATISSGTNLKLTVKGQSYLAAGDVINFNILSVENKVVSDGALDPQYAGRYVISKIRHRVTNDDYVQVLECVKDSVFNAYATDSEESFQGHPHLVENVRGQDINQYDDLDEDLEKGRPIRL